MRHLIVLPGNSPRNKEWGEGCAKHFAKHFAVVYVAEYEHWATGVKWIDLAREEDRLRPYVATLSSDTEVYVFAKSIGSILAVNSIAHGAVAPNGCAFFGMPLDHAVPEVWHGSAEPLTSLTGPTIIFHNDADPTTSYEYTRKTLSTYSPQVTFITTIDTTHDYLDFDQYQESLRPFLC